MPSKVILEKKQAEVNALAEKIRNAASGVLVQYQGITVEDDTKMRAALRKAGVEYAVIKNSITGRACDMAGYPEMKQYLEGMTAFAVSAEDPIAPAKILKEFDDKVESFQIKAGILEGNRELRAVAVEALNELVGADMVHVTENWGGASTDMGDLSCVMPVIHPYVAGATGKSHGDDYRIDEPEKACILSAEAQVAVLTKLLQDDAKLAKYVAESYTAPYAGKEAFFAEWDKFISDKELVQYGKDEIKIQI